MKINQRFGIQCLISSLLSLVVFFSTPVFADEYCTIQTIAGNGTAGSAGDGGLATEAQLSMPSGLAFDGAGNLYITDGGYRDSSNKIRKVSPAGVITTVAGNGTRANSGDGGPAIEAAVAFPADVVFDGLGNMYIATGREVRKVSPEGIIATVAILTTQINGLGIDTSGNIFVAYSAGGPGYGYVDKIDATDQSVSTITSGQGILEDVAVAPNGDIYFADRSGARLQKIDATTGVITTVAGNGSIGGARRPSDGGSPTGGTLSPEDVVLDAAGNIFVADLYTVWKISAATGTIQRIAGRLVDSGYGFAGDGGPATEALFFQIGGIAIDTSGNVYISDVFNHRVRKVSLCSTSEKSSSGLERRKTFERKKSIQQNLPSNFWNRLHQIRPVPPPPPPPGVGPGTR